MQSTWTESGLQATQTTHHRKITKSPPPQSHPLNQSPDTPANGFAEKPIGCSHSEGVQTCTPTQKEDEEEEDEETIYEDVKGCAIHVIFAVSGWWWWWKGKERVWGGGGEMVGGLGCMLFHCHVYTDIQPHTDTQPINPHTLHTNTPINPHIFYVNTSTHIPCTGIVLVGRPPAHPVIRHLPCSLCTTKHQQTQRHHPPTTLHDVLVCRTCDGHCCTMKLLHLWGCCFCCWTVSVSCCKCGAITTGYPLPLL